jgi:hypothetical protein
MLFGHNGPLHQVAFKSTVNHLYWSAHRGDHYHRLFADRECQNEEETFQLEELSDGTVSLKCEAYGLWVNGDTLDGQHLKANQTGVKPGEKFILREIGNHVISLQSNLTKKYVTGEMKADAAIRANRQDLSTWERHDLVFVNGHQPALPPPPMATKRSGFPEGIGKLSTAAGISRALPPSNTLLALKSG